MAPDERDRRFDKALARHLRSAAPSGEAGALPVVPASESGACPDSETLAAYHERSLLPEEMNSWKEHIVGCANCQTIFAHLEATDEIPFEAAEEEKVLAQGESALLTPASNESQSASPRTLAKKSRRVRLLRGARWQWLAPAGALAAGLLVWIALHENQSLRLATLPENENKMAQNRRPASVPSVSTVTPQPSPSGKPSGAPRKPQSPVSEYAISTGRVASEAAKQSEKLRDEAETRSSKASGDKELSARKDGARDASVDLLSAANQANLDSKSLSETLRKKEDAQSQTEKLQAQIAQSQNAQTQNQYNYAPQKVPGPGPLNQAETLKKAKGTAAAPPAAPSPPAEAVDAGESSFSSSAAVEVARAITNAHLISPPGSNLIWRAGRSGLIELSKDGGSSWSRQTSGVLTDLLTGSAPSDRVCWIVGRVGAILLTTDGGAHWRLIPSPLSEDLGGIRATDALHATIWNARNTKSFETSDGGLNWKRVPNP